MPYGLIYRRGQIRAPWPSDHLGGPAFVSATDSGQGQNQRPLGNSPASLLILPFGPSTPDGHLDQLFGPF
ncbi:MAG: hypothetical protein EB039_15600, partial [Proteobacteria bacterium]|nr:hypothetical protein [Pseudomonadota bacterium]